MALLVFVVLAIAVRADGFFRTEDLLIGSEGGRLNRFTVELALTPEQRQQGLMNRQQMAADHGMLFDFGKTQSVLMWMKNTPLPLDMIFMDEGGVITHIQENATPFSEAIISSGGPVRFVLEVNGGVVRKLGISSGDKAVSSTIGAARP